LCLGVRHGTAGEKNVRRRWIVQLHAVATAGIEQSHR
jgi:hypothetical protein